MMNVMRMKLMYRDVGDVNEGVVVWMK